MTYLNPLQLAPAPREMASPAQPTCRPGPTTDPAAGLPREMSAALAQWKRLNPHAHVTLVCVDAATVTSESDCQMGARAQALLELTSITGSFRASLTGVRRLLHALLLHPDLKPNVASPLRRNIRGAFNRASQRRLYRQRFIQSPESPGAIYAFFEARSDGSRVLFHTGGGSQSRCLILLWPDEGRGFCLEICSPSVASALGLERNLISGLEQ